MQSIAEPIFVIGDTVFVHRSLAEAAAFHEYRETLKAFNVRGDAFEVPADHRVPPYRLPGNHWGELVGRLRRELRQAAVYTPELLSIDERAVERASDDEILKLAVCHYGISGLSALAVAKGIVFTIVSPFLLALYPLFLLAILGGLVWRSLRRILIGRNPD
jgi:hypothetical protein